MQDASNMGDKDELRYLLALKQLKRVGPIGALKLLQHFGSAARIFMANRQALQEAGLKPETIEQVSHFDFSGIETILSWPQRENGNIISFGSPYYPPLLAQTAAPPLVLFTRGNLELLASPQIAVVGSRQPSPQGLANANQFCQALADNGFTVTSGLAMGIDGEAHRAALHAGGNTIAVTGTGLDRVYPPRHKELARLIAEKGLLVSERAPGEGYDPGSFPQRNRIIAGLSLGTLVLEAAAQSGTLITATHALEAGRDVFAIPGSIHNPLAKGCHHLIKQGAKLVESIEDILEEIPGVFARQVASRDTKLERPALDETDQRLLNCIDFEVTPLDLIVGRSQLTVDALANKLLDLELQGWIVSCAGGYIRQ